MFCLLENYLLSQIPYCPEANCKVGPTGMVHLCQKSSSDVMLIIISVNAPEGESYAVRATLSWSLIGPRQENNQCLWSKSCQEIAVNYLKASDVLLTKQINCLWRLDDVPSYRRDIPLSKDDRYALHLLKESTDLLSLGSQELPD